MLATAMIAGAFVCALTLFLGFDAQAAAEAALVQVALGEVLAQARRGADPLRIDGASGLGEGGETFPGAGVEAVGDALHAQELLCRQRRLELIADFPFQLECQYHYRADEQQRGE